MLHENWSRRWGEDCGEIIKRCEETFLGDALFMILIGIIASQTCTHVKSY